MNKSPTLYNIENNFSQIKRKLGIKRDIKDKSNNFIIVILYMTVVLTILLYFKPKFICNQLRPYDDNNESRKLSYIKFVLFYLLLNIPLFLFMYFF
jgi:hypothetical protein